MDDSYPLPPGLADYLSDLPLHELDFSPVSVKARHDGWTPARQRGFILRLALIGCVSSSATAVGMTRESAYQLRKHPGAAGFVAAWTKAIGWGRSHASDLRLTRALIGEVKRVYYRGRKIDEYVRFDNRLLMAGIRQQPMLPRTDPQADYEELRRLLEEIDPGGGDRPWDKDFLADSASSS